MAGNIRIAIRTRPLIEREQQRKAKPLWGVDNDTIYQVDSNGKPIADGSRFSFDRVFRMEETNQTVFEEVCKPIVDSVLQGYNGTIFAYGQTSSGKTYTMMGNETESGIIQLSMAHIFHQINSYPDKLFSIKVSFLQIYNDKITDMISENGSDVHLKVKENLNREIYVEGLGEVLVQKPSEVFELMKKAGDSRYIGETAMNERSSRSHTVFRMTLNCQSIDESVPRTVSQLNLVDLAGSEKTGQMGSTGDRFKEGVCINQSLFNLVDVIYNLSSGRFPNYRSSKLTRVLQNSLGGNAMTGIICNITTVTIEPTLSTLKFGARAKTVKNKPIVNKVNVDPKDDQIQQQKLLIAELKMQVEALEAGKEASKYNVGQDMVPRHVTTRPARVMSEGGASSDYIQRLQREVYAKDNKIDELMSKCEEFEFRLNEGKIALNGTISSPMFNFSCQTMLTEANHSRSISPVPMAFDEQTVDQSCETSYHQRDRSCGTSFVQSPPCQDRSIQAIDEIADQSVQTFQVQVTDGLCQTSLVSETVDELCQTSLMTQTVDKCVQTSMGSSDIADLNDVIEALKAENEDQLENQIFLESKSDSAMAQVESSQRRIRELEDTLETLQIKLRNAVSGRDQQTTKLDEVTVELRLAQSTINELQSIESALLELQKLLSQAEAEKQQLRFEKEKATAETKELNEKLQSSQSTLVELQSMQSTLTECNTELKNLLAQAESEKDQLQIEYDKVNIEIEEIMESCQILKEETLEAKQAADELYLSNLAQEKTIKDMTSENVLLESRLSQFDCSTNDELSKLKETIEKLTIENNGLFSTLDDLRSRYDLALSEAKSLKEGLPVCATCTDANTKLSAMRQKWLTEAALAMELDKEKSLLTKQLTISENDRAYLGEKIRGLKNELRKAQSYVVIESKIDPQVEPRHIDTDVSAGKRIADEFYYTYHYKRKAKELELENNALKDKLSSLIGKENQPHRTGDPTTDTSPVALPSASAIDDQVFKVRSPLKMAAPVQTTDDGTRRAPFPTKTAEVPLSQAAPRRKHSQAELAEIYSKATEDACKQQ